MSKFIKNLRGKSFNKIREKLTDVKPSSNVVIKANSKIKYKKEVTPQSFQYVIDTMEQVSPATEAKENDVYVNFPDEIYYATEMVDETYLAPYNYSVDYDYDYQYDNYEEYTQYYITDPVSGSEKVFDGDPSDYFYNPAEDIAYGGTHNLTGEFYNTDISYNIDVNYAGTLNVEGGGFYAEDSADKWYDTSVEYNYEHEYSSTYYEEETYEYNGVEYTREVPKYRQGILRKSGTYYRSDRITVNRYLYSSYSRSKQRYLGKAIKHSIGHKQKTENRQYTRVVPGGRKKF